MDGTAQRAVLLMASVLMQPLLRITPPGTRTGNKGRCTGSWMANGSQEGLSLDKTPSPFQEP